MGFSFLCFLFACTCRCARAYELIQEFFYDSSDSTCSGSLIPRVLGRVLHVYDSEPCFFTMEEVATGTNVSMIISCDTNGMLIGAHWEDTGDPGACTGTQNGATNFYVPGKKWSLGECVGHFSRGAIAGYHQLSSPLPVEMQSRMCFRGELSRYIGAAVGGCQFDTCPTTTTTNETSTTSTSTVSETSFWSTTTTNTTTTTSTTTTANTNNTFSYYGQDYTYGDSFVFIGSPFAPRGEYFFYGVATDLNGDISPGDTSLPVSTLEGFNIGDTVMIGFQEFKQIVSFSSIVVNTPIQGTYGPGTPIVQVVDSDAANSAGDPISWFGKLRTEYHLPVDEAVLLFQAPHFQIFGKAFEGWNDDQWIKEIVVKTSQGDMIADVRIKDLVRWSRNGTAANRFDTLDVNMWESPRTPLHFYPPPDAYFYKDDVTVMFIRADLDDPVKAQLPRRECAMVASPSGKVAVCSASAHEWFGELGLGGFQYAHLDLDFFDLQFQHYSYTGVLPEMWGVAPMSDRTRSFIVSETGEHPPAGTVTRATVDTPSNCTNPIFGAMEKKSIVL